MKVDVDENTINSSAVKVGTYILIIRVTRWSLLNWEKVPYKICAFFLKYFQAYKITTSTLSNAKLTFIKNKVSKHKFTSENGTFFVCRANKVRQKKLSFVCEINHNSFFGITDFNQLQTIFEGFQYKYLIHYLIKYLWFTTRKEKAGTFYWDHYEINPKEGCV